MKEIFGEALIERFQAEKEKDVSSESVQSLRNIFSSAFSKFDDFTKKLEQKEAQIRELKQRLEATAKIAAAKEEIDNEVKKQTMFYASFFFLLMSLIILGRRAER